MVNGMDTILKLLQILLDAGLILQCCQAVFKQREDREKKDFLLLPIITIFFMAARAELSVGSSPSGPQFAAEGYEIAPSNNVVLLLILILLILLMNSVYYKLPDNGWAFCGTMAVFSLYLLVRTVSMALLSLCGIWGNGILIGSRLLSLLFIFLLSRTDAFDRGRDTIKDGGFTARLVSANIGIVLIMALSIFSFDISRFMGHLRIIGVILLLCLLADGVLLHYNQRRIQEQKYIQMIEQYVPIVEELISQVRARQHEFNNRIMSIESAVSSAATLEEAKENVAALMKGISLSPRDRDLLVCDSKIIAGMLYGKVKQAEFLDISIELDFQGLFKKSDTPETEWIEVIGILLDNALEASSAGDTVYLKTRQEDRYLELTVWNPAAPLSNTEFMKLFGKGVTTKKDRSSHGFGLYNVLKLAERCHGKIVTRNETVGQKNYVVFGILLP